jgi:hypothetical protein
LLLFLLDVGDGSSHFSCWMLPQLFSTAWRCLSTSCFVTWDASPLAGCFFQLMTTEAAHWQQGVEHRFPCRHSP